MTAQTGGVVAGADTAQTDPGSIVGVTSCNSNGSGWVEERQPSAGHVCGERMHGDVRWGFLDTILGVLPLRRYCRHHGVR